jgi:hypothetical protein
MKIMANIRVRQGSKNILSPLLKRHGRIPNSITSQKSDPMPATPGNSALRPLAEMRARPPETIDETWKDDVVNRLLLELKRQLFQLENAQPAPGADEAQTRAVNVRTLANIEHTLDRLLRLEEQRTLKRETKVAKNDDDALAELERRLDQLAAAAAAPRDAAKPDAG